MPSRVSPDWTTWIMGVGVTVGVAVVTGVENGVIVAGRTVEADAVRDVPASGVSTTGCEGVITLAQAVSNDSATAKEMPGDLFIACRTPIQRLQHQSVKRSSSRLADYTTSIAHTLAQGKKKPRGHRVDARYVPWLI